MREKTEWRQFSEFYLFFRSSKAEDIEKFSIQQNEEVKAEATAEEKTKEVVKDFQKTLQTPLTGELLLFSPSFLVTLCPQLNAFENAHFCFSFSV